MSTVMDTVIDPAIAFETIQEKPPESTAEAWTPMGTLPGTAYTSDATWQAEREQLFSSEWICVGREEEIAHPADFMVRPVGTESIIVARSKDGGLRAYYNVCAHRGTKLCDDGAGQHAKSGVFKCPYHAWTFDLEGHCVGTPNVHEEEGFDKSTRPLWKVAIDTWEGFIFVNLSDEGPAEGLDEYFARNPEGDPHAYSRWQMKRLRVGYKIEYTVAANWKIVLDNYQECLHCPSVHPELVQLVPRFRKGLVEAEWGAELAKGAQSLTMTGKTSRPPLPGLEEHDKGRYFGLQLYPTLLLNLHADCVMTYRVEPIDPGHTRIVSEYLFDPEVMAEDDFDPRDIVDFWDMVSRQDWEICERQQTGIGSRAYAKGGVYPWNDRWVYEFNKRYAESMGEAPPQPLE
jgi:Rieske 2Fe-2S family protein